MDRSKRNLPAKTVNTLITPTEGLTMEMLIVCSGSSERTIKQWKKDGLVPIPLKSDSSSRGRPCYRFPIETARVVQRLAAFRRLVNSVRDAKFWLWLEGSNHLGLTDLEIETHLRSWHRALWEDAQQDLRFPVPVEDVAWDEDTKEDLLDELDRAVRQPLQAQFPIVVAEAGTSALALMLGLADERDVQEWCRIAQERLPGGSEIVGFVEATVQLFGQVVGMPNHVNFTFTEDEEQFVTMLMAEFLPRFVTTQVPWSAVR